MFRKSMGEYLVGIRKYDTAEMGDELHKRRISLTFFYPSESWEKECPYKDATFQRAAPFSKDNGVHTFCGEDAPLTEKLEKFPVLLYNHGLSGFEMESTVLCADLASKGYVVVSIGHPYGAEIVTYMDGSRFENPESFDKMKFHLGEIEPLWYEDMLTAIRFLKEMNRSDPIWKEKLLLEGMGAVGVSFGGCCSIVAALKNKELAFVVNLDGSLFVEPEYVFRETPILIICSPFNRKAYAELLKHGCTHVEVEKMKKISHFEFSDGVYLSEKGKKNRDWANAVSKRRAERVLKFLKENGGYRNRP